MRDFEPHIALTPGPRGTEAIERILDRCRRVNPRIALVLMEVGFGQEESVRELAARTASESTTFLDDLAGIPRVVVLSRHGE